MKKEHTPTPWRRRTYTSNAHVITKGDKDIAYTPDFSETGKEDADFIVKSVNNHDRLVSELEHVVKALETVSSFGATTPIIEHAKQLLTEIKHDTV